jgi:hypothetical protein
MNKGQHTQAELQAMLREYLARDRVILRRLEGWKRVGRVLQRNGEELLRIASVIDGICLQSVNTMTAPPGVVTR